MYSFHPADGVDSCSVVLCASPRSPSGSHHRGDHLLIGTEPADRYTMDDGSTALAASSETGSQDSIAVIKDSIKQDEQRENVVGPNPGTKPAERTPLDASSETASQDWVVMIKRSIKQHAERKNVVEPKPRKVMRRMPQSLRELEPEQYGASNFPIGLFNRSPLNPLKSRADCCKVAMATAVLEIMGMTETDWEKFCSMVLPNPEEIQEHYDRLDRDPFSPREVQSVLVLDAVFLAGFLGARYHRKFAARFPSLRPVLESIIDDETRTLIIDDLIKVENQIPLSLIRTVLRILVEKVGGDSDTLEVEDVLSRICWRVVPHESIPGYDPKDPYVATEGLSFLECENFLDCAYRTIIRYMSESQEGDSTEAVVSVILPSVTELQKAGIQFRGCKGIHDIKFKPGIMKGTLYLPTLCIQGVTEKDWRNMMAYEQLTSWDKDDFTQFLALMDMLIDSPNDVMILRSGRFPIILNSLGTNEAAAQLFNGILKNTGIGESDKWIKLHHEMYDFYNKRQRQMYLEFKETYFGKPWLTVSVVAAIVLLIMTLLQTYYTIAEYYHF